MAVVLILADMFNINRGIMAATTGAGHMAVTVPEMQDGDIVRYTTETVTDFRGVSVGSLRSAGQG